MQQRAAEQLFAVLTAHLDELFAKSPLAISLNVQEFHPVLNFKKNNLHEYVKKRGPKPGGAHRRHRRSRTRRAGSALRR